MSRVSVILNCYNGERFVKEAIDSVFAQSFPDWEIIFWDNASMDSTPRIATAYTSDPRMRYFRSERNLTLGHARKLAMAEARGEWIAFVDHDDTCMPNRFERQLAAIGSGDYSVCYAGIRNVDETGRIISDWLPAYPSGHTLGLHLKRFDANMPTMMLNAAYLNRFDIVLDESYNTAEDYDLFMRLAAKGAVCVLPEVMATYRVWQGSMSERTLDQLARERAATHDKLREDPAVASRYAKEFAIAEEKNVYYCARFAMYSGDPGEAQRQMAKIRFSSPIFFALWIASYWRWLWNTGHNRKLKTWLITKFLKI